MSKIWGYIFKEDVLEAESGLSVLNAETDTHLIIWLTLDVKKQREAGILDNTLLQLFFYDVSYVSDTGYYFIINSNM